MTKKTNKLLSGDQAATAVRVFLLCVVRIIKNNLKKITTKCENEIKLFFSV